MLSVRFVKAIDQNRNYMLEELLASDILPDIRSKYFTAEDIEKIENKVENRIKISTLLDLLLEKDDSCFENFLEIVADVSEHVAERLTNTIDKKLIRRLNHTDLCNLLACGGVPDRFSDYVSRKSIENELLSELKKENSNQSILVHGDAGCGKSSIVSSVLHSTELIPQIYSRVCWMPIGRISENAVLSTLITLCTKLDPTVPDPKYTIHDLYKGLITEKVRKNNILLILDDIWSDNNIMQYFTFPMRYIVTSRNSSLFAPNRAVHIEVPSKFSNDECIKYLNKLNFNIPDDKVKEIIKTSFGNPLCLSMMKNLLMSNADYINIITDKDVIDSVRQQILKGNMDILSEELRRCYSMLVILNEDETVSINVLAIYWDIPESQAIGYTNTFFDNHLINRKWIEEYKCNMYGIHDMHNEYLKSRCKNELKEYQRIFIDRHIKRFQNWLSFTYRDPCFFIHCASILTSLNDENTLIELFTDFTFLATIIVVAGITELLFNYEKYRPSENCRSWNEFELFFIRHHHLFVSLPNVNLKLKILKVFAKTIQLALFENKSSKIFEKAMIAKDLLRRDYWTWENSEPSMKMWEASNIEDIDLVDINQWGILTTSENGQLSLYEVRKGKCIFTYKITEEKIILSKFLKADTLEILILTDKGNATFYNFSKLLGQSNKLHEDDNDDGDGEYFDDESTNNNNNNNNMNVDFNTLRQKLQNISISGVVYDSIKTRHNILKYSRYVTGFIDNGILTVARQVDSNMKIEYYGLEGCILKSDFIIPFQVKKIVHQKNENGKYYQFYFLRQDGSRVDLYDDDGNEVASFSYGYKIIYDFILVDRDIYLGVENEIYTSNQAEPLFVLVGYAKVIQISICKDRRLMALCLTNQSIQIWNIMDCRLLYSIAGFSFTESMFECCNHLIAIEKGNVSKWSTDHINHDNNNNKPKRHIYRKQFYMHCHNPSLITWIVQRYNNEIEFLTFDNEKYLSTIRKSNSKITCIANEGNYVFIGFKSSHVRIFDITGPKFELALHCDKDVNKLVPFSTDHDHWKLMVNFNKNMIKIFRISKLDYSLVVSDTKIWENCSLLKIFKTNSNELLVGISFDNKIELYIVNKNFSYEKFLTKAIENNINIIDFDLNDIGTFICASTSNGVLKVWQLDDVDFELVDGNENPVILRKCTFRPTLQTEWNVIATVSDTGVIRLFYFYNYDQKVNIIIEDNPPSNFDIFPTMIWTNDGAYLILGETDIKRWKVPKEPDSKLEVKHPLTTLHTFAGGNYCVQVNDTFICTIDRLGYFYILKKSNK